MDEKKYIDLINKELDGDISGNEKNQLQQYIKNNPNFKNVYIEMMQTSKLRKQVNDLDPPPTLKNRVLDSIDSNRYVSINKQSPERSTVFELIRRMNPRVAIAFAAGLILGIVIYSVFLTNTGQNQQMDITKFYGTIGLPDNRDIQVLDHVRLDSNGLRGRIQFNEFKQMFWFEIDLDVSDKCDMKFIFDRSSLMFSGLKPVDYSKTLIENMSDSLRIMVNESCHFLLLFTQLSNEKITVDLDIKSTSGKAVRYHFQVR